MSETEDTLRRALAPFADVARIEELHGSTIGHPDMDDDAAAVVRFESSGVEVRTLTLGHFREAHRLVLAERGKGMSEWQPIETAPKDGTEILLLFTEPPFGAGDTNIAVGFWSNTTSVWDEETPWFASEADSKPLTAFGAKATHWMPLPPPPAQ